MRSQYIVLLVLALAVSAWAQQQTSTNSMGQPAQGGFVAPQPVTTQSAPAPIGDYSQAIKAGGFVFVSGQLPIDPATGKVVGADNIALQTDRVLRNIDSILRAAGSSRERIVRTTVFLNYIGDLPAMDQVYRGYFQGTLPARSVVEAQKLPEHVLVEIEAVALQ